MGRPNLLRKRRNRQVGALKRGRERLRMWNSVKQQLESGVEVVDTDLGPINTLPFVEIKIKRTKATIENTERNLAALGYVE